MSTGSMGLLSDWHPFGMPLLMSVNAMILIQWTLMGVGAIALQTSQIDILGDSFRFVQS